ncbi:MAG: hypothetical protein ABS68_09100 [Niastella sp. SCN 39-18]|nr:DUF305 domain-containing protein [Sphingobacteriales bacterium]ODT52258.1 MAG: hypothetical protein ABS68_09100 [Niastella sp. SCN 39-18]OJW10459.1 MAG: hypothetical protein BGO53_09785 [Sphingobacteriales bacterium 39-19]
MKKTIFLLASAVVLLLTACTKDNGNNQYLQPHDDNRMMDTMHAIMDRMMAMPMTNDPEIDFSKMMIMHHQGAMNMANVQLQDGKNDSLKRTAQKIIRDQQMEIQQFQAILATLTVDNTDMEYMMEQMEGMKKMDKAIDVQLITGDIDNDFATLMIWHHQSAIDDASGYLHHGNNAQLKTIANNIIKAQTMEIQELSDWLIANR